MKGARILVVDDDPAILLVIRRSLAADGFNVETMDRGKGLIDRVASFKPDIVLLDLMLPDADGIELCRALRGRGIGIIVLSAIGDDRKKVEALDEGADDYLTKPFSVDELLARIRVALRHQAGAVGAPVIEVGPLQIDLGTREVTVDGWPIRLTPKEFDLLRQLARHPGRVLTQRMLLSDIWGPEYVDDSHVLRTFIHQLRSKLDQAKPGSGS